MCDPVSAIAIGTFITSAAGAIVNYQAEAQYADAQQQVESQRFAETEAYRFKNAEAARNAFVENAAQLRIKQRQEAVVQADEAARIQREQRRTRGTVQASAISSGIGLDLILQDVDRSAGLSLANLTTQQRFDDQQTEQELTGYRAQALDAIASARPYVPQPVQRPSRLGLAVDLASAGFNSASSYYNLKAKRAA